MIRPLQGSVTLRAFIEVRRDHARVIGDLSC